MSIASSSSSDSFRFDRLLRPFEATSIEPAWIGFWIAVSYLLIHCAFDATFLVLGQFSSAESPMWASDQWWTDVVNAALIGYLPAAHAVAKRGVDHDLSEWPPERCADPVEFASLRQTASGDSGPIARAIAAAGAAGGIWLAFVDPTMAPAVAHSPSDPVFVWALIRMMLMGWLLMRFAVYDFATTRTYIKLGRTGVRVDLLDIRALAPIVRRGQRSALTWVIFSTVFSLFWLGNAASQSNVPLLVAVLSMATLAFVGPLAALRQNIVNQKRKTLDSLRRQIQSILDQPDLAATSPQLANTSAYYQLIENTREWPVDAANLLKFIGYLSVGLGSWLGGAVAERILDSALRG